MVGQRKGNRVQATKGRSGFAPSQWWAKERTIEYRRQRAGVERRLQVWSGASQVWGWAAAGRGARCGGLGRARGGRGAGRGRRIGEHGCSAAPRAPAPPPRAPAKGWGGRGCGRWVGGRRADTAQRAAGGRAGGRWRERAAQGGAAAGNGGRRRRAPHRRWLAWLGGSTGAAGSGERGCELRSRSAAAPRRLVSGSVLSGSVPSKSGRFAQNVRRSVCALFISGPGSRFWPSRLLRRFV